MAILSTVMPFILIYFIRKYHSIIKERDPKLDPINSIFAYLSTSTPATLYYTAFFMLRRLLFAFSTIFMNSIPILQIYTLFGTSLANLLYLVYFKPFDTPLLNRVEIFNELSLYLMSYPCLMFTDISFEDASGSSSPSSFASSTKFKYDLGWFVVGGVLFNIGVNMLIMTALNLRMLYRAMSRTSCLKKKEAEKNKESSPSSSLDQVHHIKQKEEESLRVVKQGAEEISEEKKDPTSSNLILEEGKARNDQL